jgi:hypothetical protein
MSTKKSSTPRVVVGGDTELATTTLTGALRVGPHRATTSTDPRAVDGSVIGALKVPLSSAVVGVAPEGPALSVTVAPGVQPDPRATTDAPGGTTAGSTRSAPPPAGASGDDPDGGCDDASDDVVGGTSVGGGCSPGGGGGS